MNDYIKNENIILRSVPPFYFFVDITESYASASLYETNEVGAFIWNNMEKVNGMEQLVKLLMSEISSGSQISYIELESDIQNFFLQLLKKGIIAYAPKVK